MQQLKKQNKNIILCYLPMFQPFILANKNDIIPVLLWNQLKINLLLWSGAGRKKATRTFQIY